jgi:hypothetical protein
MALRIFKSNDTKIETRIQDIQLDGQEFHALLSTVYEEQRKISVVTKIARTLHRLPWTTLTHFAPYLPAQRPPE